MSIEDIQKEALKYRTFADNSKVILPNVTNKQYFNQGRY